jgi:hypothetical protein
MAMPYEDRKTREANKAIMERSKYHSMDPMEAIQAQQRDETTVSAVQSLREQYPHLSEAQARQMVDSYQKQWDGEKQSTQSLRYGTPEKRIVDTVGPHWNLKGPERQTRRLPAGPQDPGDRIRDLMPGKLEPFIIQHMGPGMSKYVPNPEWGKQNGMIWDGEAWVTDDPRKSSAHDLDMEMKRLEMERLRQQMALEQQLAEEELRAKRGSTGVAGGLRDWLNKRLGGG